MTHLLLAPSGPLKPVVMSGCLASTTFSPEYRCNYAIDNDPKTDWASAGQGTGMWYKVCF